MVGPGHRTHHARTPGLFSLITLWADDLYATHAPAPRAASWYPKPLPTFSDALAAVRRELWTARNFETSSQPRDIVKVSEGALNRLISIACYAA